MLLFLRSKTIYLETIEWLSPDFIKIFTKKMSCKFAFMRKSLKILVDEKIIIFMYFTKIYQKSKSFMLKKIENVFMICIS